MKIIYRLLITASFILCISVLLTSCSNVPSLTQTSSESLLYPKSVEYYLQRVEKSESPDRENYQLMAIGRMIEDNMLDRANQLLRTIPDNKLNTNQRNRKRLLQGKLALLKKQPSLTLSTLSNITDPGSLTPNEQIEFHQILANTYALNGDWLNSIREYSSVGRLTPDNNIKQESARKIWDTLNQISPETLRITAIESSDPDLRAWLDLAYISQRQANDPAKMMTTLTQWKQQHPNHLANLIVLANPEKPSMLPNNHGAKNIALLLPLQGALAKPGQAVRDGFMAAYQRSPQHSTTHVQVYDTTQGGNALAIYQQAVAKGANIVAGPLDKNSLQMLLSHGAFPVPTLALNYTDSRPTNNLYEFGLSPTDEAEQVAQRARSDGHRRALILAPKGAWGNSIANAFSNAWENLGGEIIDRASYGSYQHLDGTIKRLLQVRLSGKKNQNVSRRQDADMIFIVAYASAGRQIVPLLRFYYAQDLAMYGPSLIYAGTPSPDLDRDLDGITFCDMPWIFSEGAQLQSQRNASAPAWPETLNRYARLYALGMDAFKIANQLTILDANPQLGLAGVTGTLYLDDKQIKRRLSCAQMRDGQPQLL